MLLPEIMSKYKKSQWLRVCARHSINKWDIVDYLGAPVYANRYYIKKELELATRVCLKCGKSLSLATLHGNFFARLTCECGHKDNKNINLLTSGKLSCMLTKDQILLAVTEANKLRRKGLPNTIEYWANRGYSVDQAMAKISELQKNRSDRSPAAKKGSRSHSIRTIEYWMKRGLSQEAAAAKVREVQITNGLEFYTKKYGQAGKGLYTKRITQWLNADGNKKMVANRSKKSIKLFEQLGVGHYGVHEKTVRGKQKSHRVDFLYGNKIIEYYGDYWHGNPKLYTESHMIRKKKVSDVWAHDAKKVGDLVDNGYAVLIIWECDYVSDPENTVKKCKDFIK